MTLLVDDGLSKFVLSPENKREERAKGHKSLLFPSESSSVTRKFVTAFSEFHPNRTAFPAVSFSAFPERRQTDSQKGGNNVGDDGYRFGEYLLWIVVNLPRTINLQTQNSPDLSPIFEV